MNIVNADKLINEIIANVMIGEPEYNDEFITNAACEEIIKRIKSLSISTDQLIKIM